MSLTAAAFLLAFAGCAYLAVFVRPMYGLYLYIAVFYLHPPSRWWGSNLPDLRWSLLAAVITLASVVIHKYLRRPRLEPVRQPQLTTTDSQTRANWLQSPIAKGLLIYTAWMWFQAPWVISDAHTEGVVLFTKYVLLFFLIFQVVDNENDFLGFCLAHVAGCAYLGWLIYLAPDAGRLDGVGGPGIDDSSSLGMQLATGLFFASFLMLGIKGWRRILTLVALPLIVNGIIQTETRGVILAIVAGGIVTIALKPRQYRGRFYFLAVAGLIGVLAVANEAFIERMHTIRLGVQDTSQMDGSAATRIVLAKAQLGMFADYPLGVGHQGTAVLSRQYLDSEWLATNSGDRASHNTVLSILVDQGIVGIAIFIYLLFSIVRLLMRMKTFDRMDLPDTFGLYRAALGGSIVVIYAAGMFTQYLKAEVQIWVLALLTVLWHLAMREIRSETPMVHPTPKPKWRTNRPAAQARSTLLLFGLLGLPSLASGLGWSGSDFDGVACEGASQGFGPWDYYDVDEPTDANYYDGRWWEAVDVHARPGFAAMNDDPFDQGAYNKAASEFDYLLRAYPNHPQILQGVIQLELKRQKSNTRLIRYETPPECYLFRAQAFRPTQSHIPQLLGIYLQRLGNVNDAIDYYRQALRLSPDAPEVKYNLGLAYFEVGSHSMAAACALEAQRLGYPLTGLQSKLRRADFDFGVLGDDASCSVPDPN